MNTRCAWMLLAVCAGACHRGSSENVYATTEGVRLGGGLPPQLRPARTPDPASLGRRVGGLAVRIEDLYANPSAAFELQLFTNSAWYGPVRTYTIQHDPVFAVPNLPAGNYYARVRRIGYKQALFRVQVAAGFTDTLDLLLGGWRQ